MPFFKRSSLLIINWLVYVDFSKISLPDKLINLAKTAVSLFIEALIVFVNGLGKIDMSNLSLLSSLVLSFAIDNPEQIISSSLIYTQEPV